VQIDELAEEARKIPKTKRFQIILLAEEYEGLTTYAKSEEIDERVAAGRVLIQALKDMGFLT